MSIGILKVENEFENYNWTKEQFGSCEGKRNGEGGVSQVKGRLKFHNNLFQTFLDFKSEKVRKMAVKIYKLDLNLPYTNRDICSPLFS